MTSVFVSATRPISLPGFHYDKHLSTRCCRRSRPNDRKTHVHQFLFFFSVWQQYYVCASKKIKRKHMNFVILLASDTFQPEGYNEKDHLRSISIPLWPGDPSSSTLLSPFFFLLLLFPPPILNRGEGKSGPYANRHCQRTWLINTAGPN